MTTPEDTELREAISNLPIIDPHDTTVGESIGRDNLDAIMDLITLHTQEAYKKGYIDGGIAQLTNPTERSE